MCLFNCILVSVQIFAHTDGVIYKRRRRNDVEKQVFNTVRRIRLKSRHRSSAIVVLITACLLVSIGLNIQESIKSNQRRMYYINHIFFHIKRATNYIERYFQDKNEYYNLEYAGLELVSLDALLKANPQEFQVGVYSFQRIGESLSVNCVNNDMVIHGTISEYGERYLHQLLQALNDLLLQLASDEKLESENKNLTFQEINSAISSFYSGFFTPIT